MHINNPKTSAFGLIEVMIASVILSISLLGVASLQSKAMYTVVESGRQETAHQMISQLANFALNADKGNASYMVAQSIWFLGPSQLATCYNLPTGCAQKDFYKTTVREWQQIISTMLPNGNGCTCLVDDFTHNTPTIPQPVKMIIAINWKTMSGSYTTVASRIEIPAAMIPNDPPDPDAVLTCQAIAIGVTSTTITPTPTIMNICQVGFV